MFGELFTTGTIEAAYTKRLGLSALVKEMMNVLLKNKLH